MSCPVEGCCQVDGHGALAYPSLAAHNGDDAGLGLVAEGWSQLRGAAVKGGEQVLSVFVGHHPEVDLDFFDAFDHLEAVSDISGDPVLHGTPCGCERDSYGDVSTLDLYAAHHVQGDEVAPDLRVAHVPERLPNASLRQTIRRLMDRFSISGVGDDLRRRRSAALGVGMSPGPLVYFHPLTSVATLRSSPIGVGVPPGQAWPLRDVITRVAFQSRAPVERISPPCYDQERRKGEEDGQDDPVHRSPENTGFRCRPVLRL